MNKILLLASILLAEATFAKNFSKLSLGGLSPHGLVGVSYEKEITLNETLSYAPFIGVGAGLVGFMKTVGARSFYKRSLDTDKWYNRCLFIFKDCEEYISFSGYLHHVDKSSTEVTKNNQDSKYSSSSGWLSSVSLGFKSVVSKHWVYELEISQRILVSGLDLERDEGVEDSSIRKDLEALRTSTGASISVGYQW